MSSSARLGNTPTNSVSGRDVRDTDTLDIKFWALSTSSTSTLVLLFQEVCFIPTKAVNSRVVSAGMSTGIFVMVLSKLLVTLSSPTKSVTLLTSMNSGIGLSNTSVLP